MIDLFTRSLRRLPWLLLAFSLASAGCSPKRIAINSAANMLTSGTSTLGSDEDPELIGDALPFALITLESLADSAPQHVGLRLTLASGFTEYAYAYADLKAELIKFNSSYDQYQFLENRARGLYLRGKRWGMQGLVIEHAGLEEALPADPKGALKAFRKKDVPLLYWTGAAWLSAISISADRADLIAQLPQASALLDRAAELEPDYEKGALDEALMALDMSRDVGAGGGEASALKHYQRALELSKGQRASVYVGYATSIAVKKQDRAGFEEALEKAVAIDPDQYPENRLSNVLSQRRARYLKTHVEDLFDSAVEPEEQAQPK